jgi:hypothetical protein
MFVALGDALRLSRPRGYESRARRAYVAAIRLLPAGSEHSQDPALVAHDVLAAARRPARLAGRRLAVSAAVAMVAALLVALAISPSRAWLVHADVARLAKWEASSAYRGAARSGRGPSTAKSHFFHTAREDHPFLRVDLEREVLVSSVRVDNRTDCCGERALPLDVEVFDGKSFRLACERRAPFRSFTCHFPAIRGTSVRVTLAGTGFLHLKRIAVFE